MIKGEGVYCRCERETSQSSGVSAMSQGQREEQREKVGKEADWPLPGIWDREDSKNGWRVLPDIGVMLQGEEGKFKLGDQCGSLSYWRLVRVNRKQDALFWRLGEGAGL